MRNRTRRSKRILALLLCVLMCVSLAPMSAFATDGTEQKPEITTVVTVGEPTVTEATEPPTEAEPTPEAEPESEEPPVIVFTAEKLNVNANAAENDLSLIPDFYAPVLGEGETETALFSFTGSDGAARYRVYGSYGEIKGFFACGSDGGNVITAAVVTEEADRALLPAAEAPATEPAAGSEPAFTAEETAAIKTAADALPTAEAVGAMEISSPEYETAKTQSLAVRQSLADKLSAMTDEDRAAFEADESISSASQTLAALLPAFEGKEVTHIQSAIDSLPDPALVQMLFALLTGSGETAATYGAAPADGVDDSMGVGSAEPDAEYVAQLYAALGIPDSDPADPESDPLGDFLYNMANTLGDVEARTGFLTFGMAEADAQSYLTEKLGEDAEGSDRLAKYTGIYAMMNGLEGNISLLAATEQNLNGDWAYVSNLVITSIRDGVAPFDTNTDSTAADYSLRPGNDASDSNKLVRSFDDITYNMTVSTTTHGDTGVYSIVNGYLCYEFTIPGYSAEQATFNTAAMSWIGTPVTDLANIPAGQSGYVLTEGASSVTIRGKYYCTPYGGSVNAFPGQVMPYATVRVNAAKNGDEIIPTFKWWADHNTETGSCPTHGIEEFRSVTADKVTVTAQMRLNVQLKQGHTTSVYSKGSYDFTTDNTNAMDADAGVVVGRMTAYGITLQLYNDNANNGLKGLELPSGPITLALDLSSQFVPLGGTETDVTANYTPLVWSFGELDDRFAATNDGRNKRANDNYAYPQDAGPLNTSANLDGCFNGGNWVGTRTGNTVNITVSGYAIDVSHLPIADAYRVHLGNIYGSNIGCFSAGAIYVLQPFYNETNNKYILDDFSTTNGELYLTISESNLSATSVSGTSLPVAAGNENQIVKTDDNVKAQINLKTPGTFAPRILWSYSEVTSSFTDVFATTTYMQNGQDWTALAGTKSIKSAVVNYENGDVDNRLIAYNQLVKFDSRVGTPVGNPETELVTNMGQTVTFLYATKADGQPWIDDAEMSNAKMEDLKYYASLADIPAGHACIGYVAEVRPAGAVNDVAFAIVGTHGMFMQRIALNTADLSLLGHVYATAQQTIAWDKLDYAAAQANGGIPSLLTNNPASPITMPTTTYNLKPFYTPAYYDESGYAGGHNGGYEYGDSLYIVPWQATITKAIAQQVDDGTGNMVDKNIYVTSSGERVVDFVLKPVLSSGMTTPSTATTNVTITDTLPAKITYIPGSTYFGGTYTQNTQPGRRGTVAGGVNTEPTAVKNADGTTTLTWLLENVQVDAAIPAIYYSCDIGQEGSANDVVDGENFTNTVEIKAVGDKRDITAANRNIATAGFSISTIGAAAISKLPISRYNEPGENFGWVMNMGNRGDSTVSDCMLLDTMPESGYLDNSFSCTLKVVNWKINTAKLTNFAAWRAFYTTSPNAQRTSAGQYTAADVLAAGHTSMVNGNSIVWTEVSIAADGTVNVPTNVAPTALILIGDMAPGEACETTLVVNALTGAVKADDVFVNFLSSGDSSTSTHTYIVSRSLEGITWIDANYDGQRGSDEEQLSGVTVTLLKLKAGGNPDLESDYEDVLDNSNNPVTITIGATGNQKDATDGTTSDYVPNPGDTGRYKFVGLTSGTYAVRFSGEAISQLRASPVDQGADTTDSDGNPSYANGKLTQTFIGNIVMPAKENMATSQFNSPYHDSGFLMYAPFSFTKVTGNDTTKPLAGAEFAVYKCSHVHDAACGGLTGTCNHTHSALSGSSDGCWDTANPVCTVTSAANTGLVTLTGLASGDYALVETKAPDGYQLANGYWLLEVNVPMNTVTVTAQGSPPAFIDNGGERYLPNYPKTVMPTSGGKGTTAFVFGGTMLIGTALILSVLPRKRRYRAMHSR